MKRILATLALIVPLPAAAHVHLHPERAPAGAAVEIALQIGHGCAGAATTALRLALPEGLSDIRPVPKAGWDVSVVTAVPGGRVTEIRWTGGELADDRKDSFVFAATPEAAGEIALPVIQTCGAQETRWIERGAAAEHPAPVLTVVPGA